MADLVTEASALGALLEDTQGVVGMVLGTTSGALSTVVGTAADGVATAAMAAALIDELIAVGSLLGLGELGVTSLKSARAGRVFARQAGAVVAIELDPRRPLGELETKLRTLAWAPVELPDAPAINRVPTVPLKERIAGSTQPPPSPGGTQPRSLAGVPSRAASSPTSSPDPVKLVGSGPVFAGDLEEFCISDLLEFLRHSQRTGLLMCTTSAGTGTVRMSRGMIVAADSPNALDLRQHFLSNPEIAPEQRVTLAALPADSFSDEAVDDTIGSRDLVPHDQVESARVARIYSACREMIGWTSGRFSFDPGIPVVTSTTLALSAQSILMHICQEQDEQAR